MIRDTGVECQGDVAKRRHWFGPAIAYELEKLHFNDRGDVMVSLGVEQIATKPDALDAVVTPKRLVHIDTQEVTVSLEIGRVPVRQTHDLEHSRELHVYRYGTYFDSYLATEPGREEFWSSNRSGLISYVRRGRHILVGGGLIAPDEQKAALLAEFMDFLSHRKFAAAFHNISESELVLFRRHGFQITKWGEEPLLDLGSVTWKGKEYEWVRRQVNYCMRHGLEVSEIIPEQLPTPQWNRIFAEMLEVSAECLSLKPQAEMGFFEGQIRDHRIGLRRVFVARNPNFHNRIEGFLVCNPIQNGAAWSTELYRRRKDAVRGTMAFLFHHALTQFQNEGVHRVAFCLDPAANCATKIPGDSALIRLGMTIGAWLNITMDVEGMRHFKSRFRPRYENRYVCVTPKTTLGSLWAFAQVSGLFAVNPWKVLKRAILRSLNRR